MYAPGRGAEHAVRHLAGFSGVLQSLSPRRKAGVERFFALLTERALRRGVFRSVAELETAIQAYIEASNADPKPFRWTKSADDILASIHRFCLRTIGSTA